MKIYLVRHGQKKRTGFKGTSISQEGVEQARSFGKFAKGLEIKSVYTSPYTRTKETARIIGQELGLRIEESETVKEIGVFEYLSLIFHVLITTKPPKYKESFFSRLKQLAKDSEGNILIVTHSGFIRFMKALMVTGKCKKMETLCSLYHNLGLTTLEFNGNLEIIDYDHADFLPKELRTKLPY